ncbi:hydroxypyruvate isomerase [Arboricoccus pini]|uniref:Hydroxypyruvate isomerase n=1 Tax=Arboricoccus pini TaxID=1963835 RepID=A0A212QUP9_9PROT|nr:TIM barrel protein [Arboricoccus pini]SNB63393.1 hydroxypyruvate isomerase [Arboricoccus pini]
MTSAYQYSAHLGYLFSERPFAERFAAARAHGFVAMEHPSPYATPAEVVRGWLADTGLTYTQFGLHSGDATKGEKGIAIFADRRAEFRASVATGLAYAETVGARMIHAMAGVLPAAQRDHAHWDCYIENLAYAAREAEKRGIAILVEAMSAGAVPDYFIETPDQGAEAIAATGEANLGLLLDIFHTVATGLDIETTISKHAALIRHVHIADYPGRHEPGTGTLDFAAVAGWLNKAGYQGLLGCEYVPAGQTDAGLGWLARSLKAA